MEERFLTGAALLIDEQSSHQVFGPRMPAERFAAVRLALATAVLTAACSQGVRPTVTATATEKPTATATLTLTPEPSPTPIKEPTATPTLTPGEQLRIEVEKKIPEGLFEKKEEKEALFKILSEAAVDTKINWQRGAILQGYTGVIENTDTREFMYRSVEIGASYIGALQTEYQGQKIWCVLAGDPHDPIFLYGGLVKDNPGGEFWIQEKNGDMFPERVKFTDLIRGRYYKFLTYIRANSDLWGRISSGGFVYNQLSKENLDLIRLLVETQSEMLVSADENRSLGGLHLLLPMYTIWKN